MSMRVEAVYEHGMLKPLQPLDLAENEHVSLLVTPTTRCPGPCQPDVDFTQGFRSSLQDAGPAPGLDEVRRRLSKIPGTLTADFIAERVEAGTQAVDQMVQSAGNQIRISRFTVIELTSVFAIKVRTQFINRDDAQVFLRQFRGDIISQNLEVFAMREAEFAAAERLIERHAFDLRLQPWMLCKLPWRCR